MKESGCSYIGSILSKVQLGAHVCNRLQSVNVIDLCGDQLPYGSLYLNLAITHRVAVDKVSPRFVHVLQIVQGVGERGIIGAKSIWTLGHTVFGIIIEQIIELTLLRVFYTEYRGPTTKYLFASGIARFTSLLC